MTAVQLDVKTNMVNSRSEVGKLQAAGHIELTDAFSQAHSSFLNLYSKHPQMGGVMWHPANVHIIIIIIIF